MFKLTIAYLTEADLRPERPFIPEKDDAEMYITAFVEDINLFPSVVNAERVGDTISIELIEEAQVEDFHRSLKSMDHKYYENFKTLSLSEVV